MNYILLLEILDSNFQTLRDENMENALNHHLGNKVYPGHTSVMASPHMRNNGVCVLKFKNKSDNNIEYHLHNHNKFPGTRNEPEDHDRTSILHSLKIIHDDAQKHLNLGHKIKIQAVDKNHYNMYKRMAQFMIRKEKERKISELGQKPRLDGGGNAHTLIIEWKIHGKPKFYDILKEIYNKKSIKCSDLNNS